MSVARYKDYGAQLPYAGTQIYLTNTLESPQAAPTQIPLGRYYKPIAEQHAKALHVKANVPVLVCIGNPPYNRHEAKTAANHALTGAWVSCGEEGADIRPIFEDFVEPAKLADHGQHLKNLYNLYVYFWRWALWKVFEHSTAAGPGVISFITASSYLEGDAFVGMREHMRRICDEIWILDLGGDTRSARKSENVFDIQTPVAIAVAVRTQAPQKQTPARVHYARIEGSREEKLTALDAITGLQSVQWQECPDGWQDPFVPKGIGLFFNWPLLTGLMPWQQSGVKAGRTWVIAPDVKTLHQRWHKLITSKTVDRTTLFKNSPTGRKIDDSVDQLPPSTDKLKPITELSSTTDYPSIVNYAFRSFDRQRVFADARLLDRASPNLWGAHSDEQIYLSSLLTKALGTGPALTVAVAVPDMDHFCNRGAKDTIPLYRTADASEANIAPGLLALLSKTYGRSVTAADLCAYVYGVLAQPTFTERFYAELERRELRVPLTKDGQLFEQIRAAGAHLLWLHTYGERFVPEGQQQGVIPPGAARCTKAVGSDPDAYPTRFQYNAASQTLHVGAGEFQPVAPAVYEFEVSGLKVVQLLEAVIRGDCFRASEMPAVPEIMRKALKRNLQPSLFDESDEDEANNSADDDD